MRQTINIIFSYKIYSSLLIIDFDYVGFSIETVTLSNQSSSFSFYFINSNNYSIIHDIISFHLGLFFSFQCLGLILSATLF